MEGRTLWIAQSYVPRYRTAFFDRLHDRLSAEGVRLRVVVPERLPNGHRADAAEPTGYLETRPTRRLQVAGRAIDLLRGGLGTSAADAVVVPLQGTSPDTFRALAKRRRGGASVGLWGHVGAFVKPGNSLDLRLERWQMRNADHVFAYTAEGARHAVEAGAQAVTTVGNSVDVRYLQDVTPEEGVLRLGVDARRVVGYIGALDTAKRIDFLASSLDYLWGTAPDVLVLVAGHGPDGALLDRAVERGQVVRVGYGTPEIKAAMADVCEALLCPGRVGLVAVESLAMGRPLITTQWPHHAPEVAYLDAGTSVVFTKDDPAAYAASIAAPRNPDRADWAYPTIDSMVENFVSGAFEMLSRRSSPGM